MLVAVIFQATWVSEQWEQLMRSTLQRLPAHLLHLYYWSWTWLCKTAAVNRAKYISNRGSTVVPYWRATWPQILIRCWINQRRGAGQPKIQGLKTSQCSQRTSKSCPTLLINVIWAAVKTSYRICKRTGKCTQSYFKTNLMSRLLSETRDTRDSAIAVAPSLPRPLPLHEQIHHGTRKSCEIAYGPVLQHLISRVWSAGSNGRSFERISAPSLRSLLSLPAQD